MKRYEHNFGKNPQGALSTVSGYATETTNFGETAFGILNKSTRDKNNFTTPEVVSSSTATLFSVGNGTDTDNRKNIIELKADGTVFISGVGGYDGTNPGDSKDISKELQSVHDDIDNINLDIDRIDSDIDSIHVEQDSDLVYTFIVKGENRGTINIPRDQFLKDVNYNEETNILEFLFIVRNEENEEEQKVVKIDMTDLEDIYTNGDGLNLENKQFSIKIDADTQPYINVGPNGLKIIGINEALDKKVSWDESKKVITLPADGSISALRNNGLEGGVLVCQRTYDDGATYVTEIGTTKNNLTLNSIERPKIDFAGGTSENIAYESEVKSLQDRMSTAETDIDNLEDRMDTAEGDIDTIQSDLSELIGDGEGSVQDQIKTALEDYLPLSGGTMTGNITFGSESAPDTNGHEYVDLGLPSGNLWAKYNVGATSEEEAGLYFQWGDTQGYTAEQVGDGEGLKAFSWDDYKWSVDGSSSNFSKYNASDNKTVLDPEDDAAHVNMSGNWRMPTFEECKELYLNTDIYLVPTEGEEIQGTAQELGGTVIINWTSQAEGTLKGVKFYKKGDKQTYMFVPTAGSAYEGSMRGAGQGGRLWASSLGSSGVQYAWNFYLDAGYGGVSNGSRCSGVPVRGVCPKSDSADYTGGIIISGKSDTDLVNAVGGTTTIDSIREGLATEDALNEYKTSNDEKIQSIEDKLDQEIEAGNTDKETIDNYTVNGHKISENPVLTKTDVGLNQVDNVQQIPMSMKGQAGGVAELDANGKVPSSQLELLALGEVAGTAYEGNKGAANKAAIGTNTYTGANYISKETNLTDAVLQLDEEIKATNDNLTLEHENANATYATKAELTDYLTKTDASNTYQPKGNYLTTIPSEYVTDSELNAKGYQTEAQVAAKVASLVDSAPETLDTLNELAAALGDDPNFATTVTNQIAQKADKTTATTSTAGLMSATDKDRIDKLYTSLSNFGPITHVLDNNAFTQEDGNLKFNFACTDPAKGSTSKSTYNLNVPLATQSQAGAMSASDKSKLDGIASGANKTTVDSALSSTSTNPVQNKVINSALAGKAASSHTHTISQITNLQSTLDGKAASSHTHPVSQITGLTASRALVSDSSGHPAISKVTSTELGYLDGVTSNVQTQLNGKAASSHTHTVSNISNLGSNWATALTAAKPNWITSVNIATISDLNANWDALLKSNPSGYVTRWPNISEVGSKQNLVIKLNGGTTEGTNQFTYNATAAKSINITPSSIGAAASSHTHTAAQVSGLATVAKSGSYNDLSNKPSIPQPTVKAASGTLTLWTGTETEYNDIATKDPNTLYFILES